MVLWRSIKNNFAHQQAQEGPNPARGRRAQMSAQAMATHPTSHPPSHLTTHTHSHAGTHAHTALMGTAHVGTGKRRSDETCGGGKPTRLVQRQVWREAVQTAAMGKSKRQDCIFVTSGHPPPQKYKHKNILFCTTPRIALTRRHAHAQKQGVLRGRNSSDRVVLGGKTFDVFWLGSGGADGSCEGLSKAKRNQCSFNKDDLGGREKQTVLLRVRACLWLISGSSNPGDRQIF